MTRSNFWAAMALTASAMKGFQLRMPTKTGSWSSCESWSAWRSVQQASGEKPISE